MRTIFANIYQQFHEFGIFLCGLLVVAFLWFSPIKPEVLDPWHRGTALLEEAKKESDTDIRNEKIRKAGEILHEQIALHPYHARVWMLLGYYQLEVGKLDSCIESQKNAISIGSGGKVNEIDHDAKELLNAALVQKISASADMDAALKTIRAAAIEGFENSMLDKYCGIVFSKYGLKDSSTFYLEKYIQKFPDDAEVLANIAFNYYLGGNRDKALDNARMAYAIRNDIAPLNQLLDELQKTEKIK
jgi:Flp pilus assembly protein TadD